MKKDEINFYGSKKSDEIIQALYEYAQILEEDNLASRAKKIWLLLRDLSPDDYRFKKKGGE